MAGTNIEEIKMELDSLRATVGKLSGLQLASKSSSWSAHANWKSTSASLPGEYSYSSSLVRPNDQASKLEELADEAKHDRLLKVTQSLSDILVRR